MIKAKVLTAATLSLLFLAACGSSGGLGDILGGGSGASEYEIRGTVDYVDANNRVVHLTNVTGTQSMLSNSGSGSTVNVYFDDQTTVGYEGQAYRVTDLERGDEVSVRVDESGNRLHAESMTVLRDATPTGGSTYPGSGAYGSTVRGTVRYVDTSRRTIEIDRGSGSLLTVQYETSVPVYWNNQRYSVADLERGDEIEVRLRDLGSNRFAAQDITVIRSMSSGTSTSPSSSQWSTVRGTVRSVDTTRRTIEIESATWISNFRSGTNTGSRMVVSYGTNTSVDVSGRLHPVSGLERGDVIEVQVQDAGATTPFAERIILVRDVNSR